VDTVERADLATVIPSGWLNKLLAAADVAADTPRWTKMGVSVSWYGRQFRTNLVVRRVLSNSEPEAIDRLEEAVFSAILQTRRLLHVHSERIFLVRCGEGAAVAYWLGLSFPERFAGVVAINGWLPGGLRPLGRLKACRDLSLLVVHGAWNARVPLVDARQSVATLRAGGLRVAFQSYPSSHRLTNPMLSDVDTWLMGHCTADAGI
jgi:phospholipase/carboxylesterase